MGSKIAPPQDQDDDRLDVPGVVDELLVIGSVQHARDDALLKHLHVGFVLDVENPRKRSDASQAFEDPLIARGRVELDDDYSFETFKDTLAKATEMIRVARDEGRTVFVFCTHGNNESAVVCVTYLMVAERWTLERAYKHVQQKRPASAPRHAYIEKLRLLEKEVHGHVTLRSAQVGPSMIDLMLGLRGESRPEDADETASQTTEPESVTDTAVERASFISTYSVTTGIHSSGVTMRETMMIAEQDDEYEAPTSAVPSSGPSAGRGQRLKSSKKDCIVM